jgi:hypothetical protein
MEPENAVHHRIGQRFTETSSGRWIVLQRADQALERLLVQIFDGGLECLDRQDLGLVPSGDDRFHGRDGVHQRIQRRGRLSLRCLAHRGGRRIAHRLTGMDLRAAHGSQAYLRFLNK